MACSVKYCNFCNEKLKERIVIKRVQLLINVVQEKKKIHTSIMKKFELLSQCNEDLIASFIYSLHVSLHVSI